mgnify:CR=1 FL=1
MGSGFLDFRIILGQWKADASSLLSGTYLVDVISEAGEPSTPAEVRLEWDNVRPLLAAFKGKRLSPTENTALRKLLRSLLLPTPEILDALVQAEVIAQKESKIVRIRLDVLDSFLASIPWELAEIKGELLAGYHPGYSFVRHARSLSSLKRDFQRTSLRMLFAASDNLNGLDFLDAAEHIEQLKTSIVNFAEAADVDVHIETLPDTTTVEFLATLEHEWDIVQFVGHGEIGNEYPSLILNGNKSSNEPERLGIRDLASKLLSAEVSIVNLLSCHSGQSISTPSRTSHGIAGYLARLGVPAIVSMQDKIQLDSAYKFNLAFYRQLIRGVDVEKAMILSRLAILELGLNTEWAVPILHLHNMQGSMTLTKNLDSAARLQAKFRDVSAQNTATFVDLVNLLGNEVSIEVDTLSLRDGSTGVRFGR